MSKQQSAAKKSSSVGKKSPQSVWTYCEKCRIHYLQSKSDSKHECVDNLDQRVLSGDDTSNSDFYLFDRFAYLNLTEQSKGIHNWPTRA